MDDFTILDALHVAVGYMMARWLIAKTESAVARYRRSKTSDHITAPKGSTE